MSSSLTNQDKTKEVFEARPNDVLPCFGTFTSNISFPTFRFPFLFSRFEGLHPWFCHPISFYPPDGLPTKEEHYTSLFPDPESLATLSKLLPHFPDPISIDTFLSTLSFNLSQFPTSFIGEIGLDKAFKIPYPSQLLSECPSLPKNSDLATPISHQIKVVEAQVDLAIKLKKNVSQHCVRATMDTVELLKRFKKEKEGFEGIYVCLHSFGGSAEAAKQIQKSGFIHLTNKRDCERELILVDAGRSRQCLLFVLDNHIGEISKLSQAVTKHRTRSIVTRERFLTYYRNRRSGNASPPLLTPQPRRAHSSSSPL